MQPVYPKLPNEKELFARVANGDETAFTEIFHYYNKRLYPFVLKMLKSEKMAEEVVQEVFIKLWIHRGNLANLQSPQSYIFTVATNCTLDHIRKLANDSRMLKSIIQIMKETRNETEERIDYKETEQIIDRAIELLPPQRKIIYELSKHQGLKYDEIARRLNISRNTVRNQMVESLRFIRNFIQRSARLLFTFSPLIAGMV